ncbi:MAG TPA: phosphate-starvation-inducible PsiE family protein [Anaerolineae bacterium]
MAAESDVSRNSASIGGRAQTRAHALLRQMESLVLFVIALVLIVLSVLLLAFTVYALYLAVATGQIREQAIEILDSVLLVMMTMEVVYTVALSIESHRLVAEPFLIVGAIAAIRRMLVITAESTRIELSNPDAFRNSLTELGLLAITVLAIAGSVYILRRSQKFLPPSGDQAE